MKYHACYIEPCVHVQNFACRARCVVAGQKKRGAANLIRCHCPPQGRLGDGFIDQFVEMLDPGRRPRPYGVCRKRIVPDRFLAKLRAQENTPMIQRCLDQSDDVLLVHNLSAPRKLSYFRLPARVISGFAYWKTAKPDPTHSKKDLAHVCKYILDGK